MLDTPSSENGTDTDSMRPPGRKLADFLIRQRPSSSLPPAEGKLLDAAISGQPCEIADTRPDEVTDENRVRADFIRFLVLGADEEIVVHENGVQLRGAYIDGPLDLDYVHCNDPLRLEKCQFEKGVTGRGARFNALTLNGSQCERANFDDAEISASVAAKHFHCNGPLRLTGARIGGDLDFEGAQLTNPDGDALACRRLKVGRSVFLTNGFVAKGRVRFSGAEIGGDFGCFGGDFIQRKAALQSDPMDKPRAEYALSLTNATIDGVLWLGPWTPPDYDKQAKIEGSLNLQGAHAVTLADHEDSWPVATIETADGEKLPCVISLDGFTYKRLATRAPTDAAKRRHWLLRQRPRRGTGGFRPQPFEQLISVLRDMGFEQDARRIGLLKEQILQAIRLQRASFGARLFVAFIGFFWGGFCGYGYRPHRLFVALFALWAMSSLFFYAAEQGGGFAPRDPEIWARNEIADICAARWTTCEKVANLQPFNAVTYAADTIFPIIDLQQRSTWAPILTSLKMKVPYFGERTLPAGMLYVVTWVVNLLGAIAVILLGAIMSGLVKRD
jgi:hypothetical protein